MTDSPQQRNCNGCTKCCEGWLSDTIHGYKIYPNNPCRFKSLDGCSIYQNRPKEPCINYKCAWLEDNEIPIMFKPNESGVIIDYGGTLRSNILRIIGCGQEISLEILQWAKDHAQKKNIQLETYKIY